MNDEDSKKLTTDLARIMMVEVKRCLDEIEKQIESDSKGEYRVGTVRAMCLLKYLKEGILKDMLDVAEDMLKKDAILK